MDAPSTADRTSGRSARVLNLVVALSLGLGSVVLPVEARAADLRVPVLMYHRIKKAPPDARLPSLWVAPRRFRAQLAALRTRGWRSMTAAQLSEAMMKGRTAGRKRFVISIDDGARDGYNAAAPIMERLGFRGTYCVTPGRSRRPWQLSFALMRDLDARGHEIANHSLTHADLPTLSPRALRRQVGHAKRLITRRVGVPPVTFCYPYGHHSRPVRHVVAATGHRLAFTTVHGALQRRSSAMRAPRIRVNGTDRPAALLARLRPYASGEAR